MLVETTLDAIIQTKNQTTNIYSYLAILLIIAIVCLIFMENLISVENLIEEAKKQNINFGYGNPYNRLRYYTKIGWLPHMVRKKEDVAGTSICGHYPSWVLERLKLVEMLKEKGATNEEITIKIKQANAAQNIFASLASSEIRVKLATYLSLVLLTIILLNELDIIKLGKSKNNLIIQSTESVPSIPQQIVETGVTFIPQNQSKIFIKVSNISSNSKVYITFNQNFFPATRFWVSEKKPQEGFTLELDAPVAKNTEFSWWVSDH